MKITIFAISAGLLVQARVPSNGYGNEKKPKSVAANNLAMHLTKVPDDENAKRNILAAADLRFLLKLIDISI